MTAWKSGNAPAQCVFAHADQDPSPLGIIPQPPRCTDARPQPQRLRSRHGSDIYAVLSAVHLNDQANDPCPSTRGVSTSVAVYHGTSEKKKRRLQGNESTLDWSTTSTTPQIRIFILFDSLLALLAAYPVAHVWSTSYSCYFLPSLDCNSSYLLANHSNLLEKKAPQTSP